jgi:hypothetical protein
MERFTGWCLGTDLLKELDEYEDVYEDETTSLYVRRIVPVTTESKSVIPCWVYLYNQPVNEYPLISKDISMALTLDTFADYAKSVERQFSVYFNKFIF